MSKHIAYSTSIGHGVLIFNGNRLVQHLLPGDPRAQTATPTVVLTTATGPAPHPGRELARQISGYFDYGERIRARVEFDLDQATEFALKVYNQAMEIGFGQISTYGRIAVAIGCRSSRAVGGALAANRLPLFVPCHRVLARDGMGGWSGPPGLKERMLALEGSG